MGMAQLYTDPGPREGGHLAVEHGHAVFWEVAGNPDGLPALVLHGGPGGGCSSVHRQLFDPSAYRVILMDQRGCGRSMPHAAETLEALEANTTAHLIADIERLRAYLGVERWLVLGGSWGTTLALAYAQRHPDRVRAMVLAGLATTRADELDWLYWHVRRMVPAEHAAFRAHVGGGESAAQLIDAYAARLADPDPEVHQAAADAWCAWEAALVEVDPAAQPAPRWRDPAFRLAFARIVTHYFGQSAFLEDGALQQGMAGIADIPAVLIHSRFDPSTPYSTAWELSQLWPAARLVTLAGALHSIAAGAVGEAVVAATDGFRADGGTG